MKSSSGLSVQIPFHGSPGWNRKMINCKCFLYKFSVFAWFARFVCVFGGTDAWISKRLVACKCSFVRVMFKPTYCLRWCVQPFPLFHFLTFSFHTDTSFKSSTFRFHCQVFRFNVAKLNLKFLLFFGNIQKYFNPEFVFKLFDPCSCTFSTSGLNYQHKYNPARRNLKIKVVKLSISLTFSSLSCIDLFCITNDATCASFQKMHWILIQMNLTLT